MIEVYSSLGSSYISEAWKSHLSIVIIHLAQNDYVAADKYYQSALSKHDFIRSDESKIGNDILEAFESGDEEMINKLKSKQVILLLENEVARLVKNFSFSGTKKKKQTPKSIDYSDEETNKTTTTTTTITSTPTALSISNTTEPSEKNPIEEKSKSQENKEESKSTAHNALEDDDDEGLL
eukprot:TRINITY_DN2409_c0_g1_i5.p1 TRINITY_DN2409_c0_g1~~TRINITY_DN2409_c0_g1_i5.p1  ORF type:complete len:180 (+),score=35.83 TRINITY_DN2409_c0_g1_i5:129-668(+)